MPEPTRRCITSKPSPGIDIRGCQAERVTLTDLVDRARKLIAPNGRRILGIIGAPASGKSTLASLLAEQLGAVLVPMDGFHLSDAQLRRLGRHDRKGAPDTFDAAGYVALLRRLRTGGEDVHAPAFDRQREETVVNAIVVARGVSLVITEGNYLLLDDGPWSEVRGLLDEAWFLDSDESQRVRRLTARHVSYGSQQDEAYARATTGSDAVNARLVAASRSRADLVIDDDWMTR
jgi:pantothenate kinase